MCVRARERKNERVRHAGPANPYDRTWSPPEPLYQPLSLCRPVSHPASRCASPGGRPPRAVACVCRRESEMRRRSCTQNVRGAASIEIVSRGDARAPYLPLLPAGRPVLCTLSRPHPAHLAPFVLRRALSVLEDVLSILSTAPHAPRR